MPHAFDIAAIHCTRPIHGHHQNSDPAHFRPDELVAHLVLMSHADNVTPAAEGQRYGADPVADADRKRERAAVGLAPIRALLDS